MSSLPLSFPPAEDGPGRLTEIISFRKANKSESEERERLVTLLEKTSTFPITQQLLYGDSVVPEDHQILLFDWTSAQEKQAFSSTPQIQELKPKWADLINAEDPSLSIYHVSLLGAATTPMCAYYEAAMLKIPKAQQGRFAAAMKHYLETHEKPTYSFFVVAAAQEDPEAIICLCGYPDREKAYIADKSVQHQELKKVNDPIVKGWSKHSGFLQIFEPKMTA